MANRSTILRRRRGARAAFSLIELLLVLVILAILAAVVVPKFTNRTKQANVTAAVTEIANLKTALNMYEVDNGAYPTTDEGLGVLVEQPPSLENWNGPYLDSGGLSDPWGRPYNYRCPGSHNPRGFDLWSVGPDGQEGGGDDIDNWSKQ